MDNRICVPHLTGVPATVYDDDVSIPKVNCEQNTLGTADITECRQLWFAAGLRRIAVAGKAKTCVTYATVIEHYITTTLLLVDGGFQLPRTRSSGSGLHDDTCRFVFIGKTDIHPTEAS